MKIQWLRNKIKDLMIKKKKQVTRNTLEIRFIHSQYR
jgi:hypothetical protein